MFTGREWIAEVGLYDYRNRVYSADLGRFIQTDPIRFDAGDVNLYRYVGNKVTKYKDPLGLSERTGSNAGGINNQSNKPVNVYSPESGGTRVNPGEQSPQGHDWDSVENPAGSGNWDKIGPGVNDIDEQGNIDSNWKRALDKLLRPERYEPGSFPVPPDWDWDGDNIPNYIDREPHKPFRKEACP